LNFCVDASGLRGLTDEVVGPTALLCRLLVVDVDMGPLGNQVREEDDSFEYYRCVTDGEQEPDGQEEMSYLIELPDNFVKNHSDIVSGETFLSIPGGEAIRDHDGIPAYIHYPEGIEISIVDPPRRNLYESPLKLKREGNSTVLIVRVTTLDAEVLASPAELSSHIFGIGQGAPAVNLVSQYLACSFGKLRFVPAEGPEIVDGVGEIFLSQNIVGMNPFYLENTMKNHAEAKFGTIQGNYDHVVFVLPWGTVHPHPLSQENWYAYANVNDWRSIFNDNFALSFSGLFHEIGHNLKLFHSAEGSLTYGDTSGKLLFATSTCTALCGNTVSRLTYCLSLRPYGIFYA
jgi:hypothetical protein